MEARTPWASADTETETRERRVCGFVSGRWKVGSSIWGRGLGPWMAGGGSVHPKAPVPPASTLGGPWHHDPVKAHTSLVCTDRGSVCLGIDKVGKGWRDGGWGGGGRGRRWMESMAGRVSLLRPRREGLPGTLGGWRERQARQSSPFLPPLSLGLGSRDTGLVSVADAVGRCWQGDHAGDHAWP